MEKLLLAHASLVSESIHPDDIKMSENMCASRKIEYLKGRLLLRETAAELLSCDPSDIVITKQASRLFVIEPQHLYASIAHTKDFFLCALACRPVGVDVELYSRQVNIMAIANRYYARSELSWLQNNKLAAMKLWVAKEACIKLYGSTIANNLAQYVFDDNYQMVNHSDILQVWQVGDCIVACVSKAGGFVLEKLINF